MLRYAMHLDRPLEQVGSYATFVSRMQDPDENYVFRSFAAGTSPQNGYHMSPDNFELNDCAPLIRNGLPGVVPA